VRIRLGACDDVQPLHQDDEQASLRVAVDLVTDLAAVDEYDVTSPAQGS